MSKQRYIIDTRVGGITLRDSHHPKHAINMLKPLDYLAEDILHFYLGYPLDAEGIKAQQELLKKCKQLNGEAMTLSEIVEDLNREVL